MNLPGAAPHEADHQVEIGNPCELTLRGWTGEFLQVRELDAGDYRLWHPDGSYCGRFVPDAAFAETTVSGTVDGPTGLYLADVVRGRLRVDAMRRRANAMGDGLPLEELESPGELPSVDRRWPRRG
jgi:hypothetical protein